MPKSPNALQGSASEPEEPGVYGQSALGDGVSGLAWGDHQSGVYGNSDSENAQGVFGQSVLGTGVLGKSTSGRAIAGWSETNYGVSGDSRTSAGVRGTSATAAGTEGWSTDSTGVFGISQNGIGIHGRGGSLAGFFEGHVQITGEIRMSNADFAEEFDIVGTSEPGEVVVSAPDGGVQLSTREYDRKVLGVIAGAGDFNVGVRMDSRAPTHDRVAIAVLGKVYCKVSADNQPIEAGDLLTSSPYPGHAMKAVDTSRAFGAVIGKALGSLSSGRGLVPMLVVLQ